jgi:single-strand DNA-binding protein
MDDLNRVELRGRVLKDAELRTTTNNSSVLTFVATTTRMVNGKEATDYHNIVCWQRLAEEMADLRRGDPVHIVGRLQSRSWQGQDGLKHYKTEVVAASVEPLTLRTSAATGVDPAEVPF